MSRPLPQAKTLLGSVLRTCAEEEGGLDALADRLGVSRVTVANIITNEGTPTALTFSVVASYLEVSMDTVWAWHAVRECC